MVLGSLPVLAVALNLLPTMICSSTQYPKSGSSPDFIRQTWHGEGPASTIFPMETNIMRSILKAEVLPKNQGESRDQPFYWNREFVSARTNCTSNEDEETAMM